MFRITGRNVFYSLVNESVLGLKLGLCPKTWTEFNVKQNLDDDK